MNLDPLSMARGWERFRRGVYPNENPDSEPMSQIKAAFYSGAFEFASQSSTIPDRINGDFNLGATMLGDFKVEVRNWIQVYLEKLKAGHKTPASHM